MTISRDDRDFVQSLERGLAVLQAFDADHVTLTLREAAEAAGISRPAARRLLLTLEALGYLSSDGSSYRLTTRVLAFSSAYLGSRVIHEIAERHLESFSSDVGESSSMSMLDDTDVIFVARVPVNRVRAYMLALGDRMPAYVTAQGRVLLAHLNAAGLDRFFHQASLLPLTARTFTNESRLRAELRVIAGQGWAMIDQEYEMEMRSIVVPVGDATGAVVASIGCMCHARRVSLEQLTKELLPRLREAAAGIEAEPGATSPSR